MKKIRVQKLPISNRLAVVHGLHVKNLSVTVSQQFYSFLKLQHKAPKTKALYYICYIGCSIGELKEILHNNAIQGPHTLLLAALAKRNEFPNHRRPYDNVK